jgi:hypothetical protein
MGTLIPLDWHYAFDRTMVILDLGYEPAPINVE